MAETEKEGMSIAGKVLTSLLGVAVLGYGAAIGYKNVFSGYSTDMVVSGNNIKISAGQKVMQGDAPWYESRGFIPWESSSKTIVYEAPGKFTIFYDDNNDGEPDRWYSHLGSIPAKKMHDDALKILSGE